MWILPISSFRFSKLRVLSQFYWTGLINWYCYLNSWANKITSSSSRAYQSENIEPIGSRANQVPASFWKYNWAEITLEEIYLVHFKLDLKLWKILFCHKSLLLCRILACKLPKPDRISDIPTSGIKWSSITCFKRLSHQNLSIQHITWENYFELSCGIYS